MPRILLYTGVSFRLEVGICVLGVCVCRHVDRGDVKRMMEMDDLKINSLKLKSKLDEMTFLSQC